MAVSPVVVVVPKDTQPSHMRVNFPSEPPARLLFHKFPSASDKPCTFADFPLSRSCAVLPSRPTLNLVNKNPPCSAIQGHTDCVTSIFTSHVSSITLRIVLIVPCTDWMEFYTVPLLFELPTGLFSIIILDPLFVALSVLLDSIKLVEAGSLSDFTMMSKTPTRFHAAMPSAFGKSILPSISLEPRC